MAAHGMATRSQLADAGGVEESARADAPGGDEEVPAPSAFLERAGRAHGRRAAIVERDRRVVAVAARLPQRHPIAYRLEMSLEILGGQLVAASHGPGESHRVALRRRGDVVVDQRERQARARARWRAIAVPISFTTAGSPVTCTWPRSY